MTGIERLQFLDQAVDLTANQRPSAAPDAVTTRFGAPLVIPVSALTANDSDPDGDSLSVVRVGNAQHGTVTLSGSQVTFTPAFGYVGQASFDYTVDDGQQATSTATVTVTVTGGILPLLGPTYIYGGAQAGARLIDVSGDGLGHTALATPFDDTMVGGSQRDILNGADGNDTIDAAAGNDLITGGKGSDSLTGGADRDTFIWRLGDLAAAGPAAQDEVFDFEGAGDGRATGDYLVFQGFSAGSTLVLSSHSGTNPSLFFYQLTDAASGVNQVIAVHSLNGSPLGAGDFLFM